MTRQREDYRCARGCGHLAYPTATKQHPEHKRSRVPANWPLATALRAAVWEGARLWGMVGLCNGAYGIQRASRHAAAACIPHHTALVHWGPCGMLTLLPEG